MGGPILSRFKKPIDLIRICEKIKFQKSVVYLSTYLHIHLSSFYLICCFCCFLTTILDQRSISSQRNVNHWGNRWLLYISQFPDTSSGWRVFSALCLRFLRHKFNHSHPEGICQHFSDLLLLFPLPHSASFLLLSFFFFLSWKFLTSSCLIFHQIESVCITDKHKKGHMFT